MSIKRTIRTRKAGTGLFIAREKETHEFAYGNTRRGARQNLLTSLNACDAIANEGRIR